MMSTLPHIIKLNNFKYINQLKNHNLSFTLLQSLFLHPFFFLYRNTFFTKYFKLIGDRVTDLQLTYMDNVWDELTPKKIYFKKMKKLKKIYQYEKIKKDEKTYLKKVKKSFPNIKLIQNLIKMNFTKITKTKILKILTSSLHRVPVAYINNKVYSKYLNSYSKFLHFRIDLNKKPYLKSFKTWFISIIKKTNHKIYANTTYRRVKFTRRKKIRNINKVSYKQTPKITTNSYSTKLFKTKSTKLYIYSYTTPLYVSTKPLLKFNNNPIRNLLTKFFPKKKYVNKRGAKFKTRKISRNLFKYKRSINKNSLKYKRSINKNSLKYKFIDKRILRRYSLHYKSINKPLINYRHINPLPLNTKINQYKKEILKFVYMSYVNSLDLKKKYLYNTDSALFFKSSSFSSFILRNSGLFILSKFSLSNVFPYKLKSQFKKKLFSFVYPGQSKRNVLLRRKKQVLTRLLKNSSKIIKSLNRFSYRLYYQLFNIGEYNISKRKLHSKSNSHNNLTFDLNTRNVYYNFDYQTRGKDVGDLYIHSEIRIPRIRFKPGYQRIWRQVRSALQTELNVKFQYQKQLTKYLIKFYHLSSQYLLSYSESTLDKIVVYSHLLPDMSTTTLFSFNGFLYLNGTVTNSLNTIVIKNDLIQLVVSLWYYIINRWFLNWTNNRVRKFKRLVYKKNKPLQYKLMKTKKQRSYYTPNWIYQTRYDNSDIKPYLEVDFFTLSSFVITDTYIQYYHKIDDMPDLRNSTYMLYNWKYIT